MENFTRISKSDVKNSARSLIKFLDENRINTANDLRKLISERLELKYKPINPSCVEVGLRPSNDRTFTYNVRYVSQFLDLIPLEIRINTRLNYSLIIIKTRSRFRGYDKSGVEGAGNFKQRKMINNADIFYVREELRNLARI